MLSSGQQPRGAELIYTRPYAPKVHSTRHAHRRCTRRAQPWLRLLCSVVQHPQKGILPEAITQSRRITGSSAPRCATSPWRRVCTLRTLWLASPRTFHSARSVALACAHHVPSLRLANGHNTTPGLTLSSSFGPLLVEETHRDTEAECLSPSSSSSSDSSTFASASPPSLPPEHLGLAPRRRLTAPCHQPATRCVGVSTSGGWGWAPAAPAVVVGVLRVVWWYRGSRAAGWRRTHLLLLSPLASASPTPTPNRRARRL